MELTQVFASNIQIGQLKEVIPQYEWNEKRFQEERDYFLWWLQKSKDERGLSFSDQVSAWEEYKREHEFVEIDVEDEEFTPSWMEEINQAINNAIRMGNYSEFGGQL